MKLSTELALIEPTILPPVPISSILLTYTCPCCETLYTGNAALYKLQYAKSWTDCGPTCLEVYA